MENTIWKAKSIERTKENKELKKRIIELKLSRDSWKEKYILIKNRSNALENSLKKTKKSIEMIFRQST
jgi:hypothetical protein